MKKIMFLLSLSLFLFLFGNISFACQFDTDCRPGSKCIKDGLYGVCVGGLNPGNKYDKKPGKFPLDIGGKYGDTCSFSTDCGPGYSCIKSGGIYGTCMKK